MFNFDETIEWKEFIRQPETQLWQEKVAARLQKLFEGGAPISPDDFTDISGEFPELLRDSFNLALGRRGISYKDDILELQEAQWLIGQALARIFMSSQIEALDLLEFVEDTFAWQGFKEGLWSAATGPEPVRHMLARFREAIDHLEGAPENYSRFSSEKENGRALIRQWREERDLEDMFTPLWGWDSFAWRGVPAVGVLGRLLPASSREVAELLSAITLPPVMRDTLWTVSRNCMEDAGPCFSALLQAAPNCKEAGEEDQWNGQLLAPALLQWALVYGQQELDKAANSTDVGAAAVSGLEAMWQRFAEILKGRPDGLMLARTFLAGNLPMDRGDARPTDLMGIPWKTAFSALAKIMPALPANPEEIFQETFGKSMAEAMDDWINFVETGRLQPAGRLMNLGSLLSRLPDPESSAAADNAHVALDMFQYLLACEKNGLYTTEYSRLPEKIHQAIGDVYSRQAVPAASWSQTWKELSALRHRLRQCPYGEQVIDQYSTLNFVLVAGICAARLLSEKNQAEAARSMADEVSRAIRQYSAWARLEQPFLTKLRKLYERYIGKQPPAPQ